MISETMASFLFLRTMPVINPITEAKARNRTANPKKLKAIDFTDLS